jgi:hypothetical protein
VRYRKRDGTVITVGSGSSVWLTVNWNHVLAQQLLDTVEACKEQSRARREREQQEEQQA